MDKPSESGSDMARQIAQAAIAFHEKRTGHAPASVTAVLGADTLVVTLHGALSPAEKSLARSAEGAAQVQKFHRQLFNSSCEPLRQAINQITGTTVLEAAAEIDAASGGVVQVFTNGTMVQVFQLAERVATDAWSGDGEQS